MGRERAHFHCNHTSIGRTTHRAGTGSAHAKYILRRQAAREVIGEHMPTGRNSAAAWLDTQEQAERKNGRVLDRINIALPAELTQAERTAVVREFAHALTDGGRTAWLASIHDKGDDAANPHAHLIIRDKDVETGKRVFLMSDKGSTERIRELWETIGNKHLEQAERAHGVEIGSYGRLDRRTLEAQGIEREPQIHVGPQAQAIAEKGLRPESQERQQVQPSRQGIPQNDNHRTIDYPQIDQGRSRAEHNAQIISLNAERERRRQEQLTPEDRAKQQAEAEQARRDVEARNKERRELELFKATLEQAAERRLQELAQRHVKELRPFQSSQAEAVRQVPQPQPENQSKLGALWARAADRINPARMREREEQQRQDEERRKRESDESRRRELEALLQRQERERLELERQLIETQHQQVRDFQHQQQKIREQRAKGPQVVERQRTQERGTDFGRERERGPRR